VGNPGIVEAQFLGQLGVDFSSFKLPGTMATPNFMSGYLSISQMFKSSSNPTIGNPFFSAEARRFSLVSPRT
jgi:hypothetical protein